ncbi:FAD/NAD(P)-binding domain-containing protein [Auriculariales sp. MPI-PUGE-AT-0066]|nr:FAD/NAD(P)-binding domain-containing protein [Auriculariales sp. MPI-PUGE-AT-0066]
MTANAQPLRIAIIGAGPAGLALASTLVLEKASTHLVTVYEAASELREVGAGVTISGRSLAIARSIGMEEAFNEMDQYRNAGDAEMKGLCRRSDKPEGYTFCMPAFGRGISFHRAQFRDSFAKHLEKFEQVEIKLGKRLANVERDTATGEYSVSFADGSLVIADVVVGADGYRSPTRYAMLKLAAEDLKQPSLNDLAPAIFSGQWAYRAAIPVAHFRETWSRLAGPNAAEHRVFTRRSSMCYCGIGHHIPTYLIAGRTLVNTAVFVTDLSRYGEFMPESEHVQPEVDTAHLVEMFKSWELELRAVIEAMGKANLWAINVTQKLPFFAHERIAVIGDAAHAMQTHLANGANQSIEDAYVLGRVLNAPGVTRANAHLALQSFSTTRMPRAQTVAESSREVGMLIDWMYTFPGEDAWGTDEDRQREAFMKIMEWVPKGDADDEVKVALETFRHLAEL